MLSKSSPCCYATLPDQVPAVEVALALAGEENSEKVGTEVRKHSFFSDLWSYGELGIASVLLVFYKLGCNIKLDWSTY